jgi:hypothetical protein
MSVTLAIVCKFCKEAYWCAVCFFLWTDVESQGCQAPTYHSMDYQKAERKDMTVHPITTIDESSPSPIKAQHERKWLTF